MYYRGYVLMSELGNLLRQLRGKETLRDAAARIGVSHTYLSILEKGYDQRSGKPIKPTADTLKLISKAYDYPYEELLKLAGILEEDESPSPSNKKHKELSKIESLFFYELDKLSEEDKKKALEHVRYLRYLAEQENKK
jgi:HTH-type transcriptional regulator, competence development regulator